MATTKEFVAKNGLVITPLTGYVKANGASPTTASATIPGSDISGNIAGNAATATKLASAVTIAGVTFDGSSNVTLTTSNISEGTNLYFTTARAAAAAPVQSVAGRTGSVIISTSDITGLGSIAVQAASAVAVTGGSINGTTIGASVASTGAFTSLSVSGSSALGAVTISGALNYAPTVTVASASTVDLGAQASNTVNITGSTTITSLGTAAVGVHRWVKFAGALTLTHNSTSLILPGAANITTAANDTAEFISLGSGNWQCVSYTKAAIAPGTSSGSTSPATFNSQYFTASAGQTSFTISGGYTVGAIEVFVNGLHMQTTDFTASNGSTVVFNTGLQQGTEVEVVVYTTISVGSVTTAQNVSGVVAVANGGTGATTLTGYVKGNGTGVMTAATTIPSTDISGLGSMSTQAASSVSITGGTINGTPIGATTAAAGVFTQLAVKSVIEAVYLAPSAPSAGQQPIDLNTSAVWMFNTAAINNTTLNFRGDATTTLNSMLSVGQSISAVVMITNTSGNWLPTAFQIDGVAVTPKWNGTAPTIGDTNAIDSYSFTIIKTAASTYTVLASRVKFA